jgi:hypothetical protein
MHYTEADANVRPDAQMQWLCGGVPRRRWFAVANAAAAALGGGT